MDEPLTTQPKTEPTTTEPVVAEPVVTEPTATEQLSSENQQLPSSLSGPVESDGVAATEPAPESLSNSESELANEEAPSTSSDSETISEQPLETSKETENLIPAPGTSQPQKIVEEAQDTNAVSSTPNPSQETESAPVQQIQQAPIIVTEPAPQHPNETSYTAHLTNQLITARQKRLQIREQRLNQILQYIAERKTLVAAKEIRERMKLPQTTITNYLAELVRKGLVLRLGSRRKSAYRLTQGV